MRFDPGPVIGPTCPPTLPSPRIPPPLTILAPAPVRFAAPPAEAAPPAPSPPPLRFCVAVDFDGTLCRSAWPVIGAEMPGAVAFLHWLAGREVAKALWTCRQGPKLDEALAWLAERGFPRAWWDAVNDTPEPIARHYGGDTRKIGFNCCVDDRAIGFPTNPDDASVPDWPRIMAELEDHAAAWRESTAGK